MKTREVREGLDTVSKRKEVIIMTRKIIHVAAARDENGESLYVVADDGTLWRLGGRSSDQWRQLPPLPPTSGDRCRDGLVAR